MPNDMDNEVIAKHILKRVKSEIISRAGLDDSDVKNLIKQFKYDVKRAEHICSALFTLIKVIHIFNAL